ncbi:Exodeoxyribonuclease 7 large subunit [Candidatus Magnetaquicoccaceae bacterium FCR-1]|uniref:Exodeoxyribonuclease 7 large subunit n=1 Tax=Candidatus Magnetaquiglobus chichijimensis TaxID=3141448 RepID=A0ABQ0C659_9PROT
MDALPKRPLSVSQLNEEIRALLEEGYPYLQVRGEIADWKPAPSGHVYFALIDPQARIRAVIWKTTRLRIPTLPRSGDAVVVTGRISVYPPRGEYQLVVEGIKSDGAGDERERLLALHARLSAEGLFAPARKRALPLLPRAIGVVTSASGAAIHDITRTLARRFPGFCLLLAHARVQGAGADEEIARALRRLAADGRAEVILCGRGGGSADDLAAFNSEIVVRAIADSPVPVISAVGHEIDVTLADLVADARASTPTAAAELAMAEKSLLVERLSRLRERLALAMRGVLRSRREKGVALASRLTHPRRRIDQDRLRCDALQERLHGAMRMVLARWDKEVAFRAERLNQWGRGRPLALRVARLVYLEQLLIRRMRQELALHRERARLAEVRLLAISPLGVLARGYALVRDEQGGLARRAGAYPAGSRLRVTLAEGELRVVVTG